MKNPLLWCGVILIVSGVAAATAQQLVSMRYGTSEMKLAVGYGAILLLLSAIQELPEVAGAVIRTFRLFFPPSSAKHIQQSPAME